MINSTKRSDILVFNCYLCHVRFLLTCYVCSTKIGEISDISKCFENFVSQTLGVLTRIYAAELRIDLNVAKNAIKYLDKQLEIGNPVLAGVDHHNQYKYNPKKKTVLNEGTTDHFILIIGRLCKSGIIQYLFYDPGTGSEIKGGSDENILTLNQVDYSLRGTTKYNTTKYNTTKNM